MILTLHVSKLRWIQGAADDPQDLCAHGDVDMRINGVPIAGLTAYECTVSAAALYLLRSLSHPHRRTLDPHLFPCCGFSMYETSEPDAVLIFGCPNGVDFDVRHERDSVVIAPVGGAEHRIDAGAWRESVYQFADQVASFYQASSPKQPSDEDRAGFRAFLREWRARRGAPLLSPAEHARYCANAVA
jgi:hypothetical protein